MDECKVTSPAIRRSLIGFEASKLDEGKLLVARKVAPVKVDYVLEPRQAPDFGRLELEVDGQTRVWRGTQPVPLTDIAVGEELLVNRGARTSTSRGVCSEIWIGPETHRSAADEQRRKHTAFLKEHGVPGWIGKRRGQRNHGGVLFGRSKEFPAGPGP